MSILLIYDVVIYIGNKIHKTNHISDSKVVGAIVGGVIGGIALISIIVTVIIVVTCRRRKGQGGTILSNNQNTAGITTVPQYGQPPMQGK